MAQMKRCAELSKDLEILANLMSDIPDVSDMNMMATDMNPKDNLNRQKAKTTSIFDDYVITNNILGLGVNGKVLQCFSKKTNQIFALKVTKNFVFEILKYCNLFCNLQIAIFRKKVCVKCYHFNNFVQIIIFRC